MTRIRFLLAFLFVAMFFAQPLSTPAQPQSSGIGQMGVPYAALDLNTATFQQLKALPGMGDAYANRVIKGRPYSQKNQLVSRGVLPQSVYDRIQALVIAKHPAK